MPLIIDEDAVGLEPSRLSFRKRLRTGRVVPIVSNRAIFDRYLNDHGPFLASYAQYIKYPHQLGQPQSLVNYHKHRLREIPLSDQALKFDYLNYVKNHIYHLARADGVDPDTPDEVAAEMDDVSVWVFSASNHYAGPKEIKVWSYNQHEGGQTDQMIEKLRFLAGLWGDA